MPRTKPAETPAPDLRTLAIDIGGTGVKAAVLDAAGRMVVDRAHVATPYPCTPDALIGAIAGLVASLPAFDRISAGFPGVVRHGTILTAPHFGTEIWRGIPLAAALADRLGRPARLLNDAEVQGLGVIAGQGLEVVLTLGTGIGSAVFSDGRPTPHLELAQHPIHGGKTYNEYLGDEARRRVGRKRWNRRVRRMIGIVETLLNYDRLYLGGGNATRLEGELPPEVTVTSNDAGLTGGIRLWDERLWSLRTDS